MKSNRKKCGSFLADRKIANETGRRAMHGAWFRHLDKLKEGDEIIITYQGIEYIYRVERVFVIAKNDWSVIEGCGYPVLTLTTCHPVGSARQRLVVRAKLEV